MRVLKFILVILLGFILGFASCIGAIAFGGYYIATNVTPEQAETMVQSFQPDFALPENIPTEILDMTLLEIFTEIKDIATNLDTMTLTELEARLGYEIPMELEDGTDLSVIFGPLMDIPIADIPTSMDLVVDNLTLNSLVSLGLISEEDLPNLPIFTSADSMDTPIMDLMSDFDSFKISDVITLYTGDYYPNDNGNFVTVSDNYVLYDDENPAHESLTRYNQGYAKNDEGEYVFSGGVYVEYAAAEHEGMQRYAHKMLPTFDGDYVLEATYETYDSGNPAHQGVQRYMLPDRSSEVLLSLGNAYINAVPDDDPDGLTISDTIQVLQVKDIMVIDEDSPSIIKAIQDAYLGENPPGEGLTLNETVNTIQLKDVIDIYEEDVIEGGVIVHEKSSLVLIALQDAYVGSEPSNPLGLTITETIDILTLGEVIEITEDSAAIMVRLKDTLIKELGDELDSLKLKEAMDIYTEDIFDADGALVKEKSTEVLLALAEAYIGSVPAGHEGEGISDIMDSLTLDDMMSIYDLEDTYLIADAAGDYYRIPAVFETYDEIAHSGLSRYRLSASDGGYYPDDAGLYALTFPAQFVIDSDPVYIAYMGVHPGAVLPRYGYADKSSDMLVSLRTSTLDTIDSDVQNLALGDVIEITDDSNRVLRSLKDTSINGLNIALLGFTLADVIDIYEEDEYYEDAAGAYVFYNNHYTLYDSGNPAHDGLPRYGLHARSSEGLLALSDANINNLSAEISDLKLSDVQPIYDGYEYYENNDAGTYIIDGYTAYVPGDPYHAHLTRYNEISPGVYEEVNLGDYVLNYRLALTPDEDAVYPRYALRAASSRFFLALADTPLNDMDGAINSVSLGDMVLIDSSSPRILQTLAGSSVLDLEDNMLALQLKDVIDIYDTDKYEEDLDGYFVYDVGLTAYIEYDEGLHSGWLRYTRTVGVADDDTVYGYAEDGDYVLILGTPDTYELYDEILHAGLGLPRYDQVGVKSSPILISLQDSYIYGDGLHDTLTDMLNNITLVDILGEPEDGSLLEAISYYEDAFGEPIKDEDHEVKVNDVETRTIQVMITATLGDLAYWGIITPTAHWGDIEDMTIQEALNYFASMYP